MANQFEHLARRLEDDPFFLACPLKLHAKSEGLDEQQLARALGCATDTLLMLFLCRAPTDAVEDFQKVIDQVAGRFQVDVVALTEAIRRGQAILELRRIENGNTRSLIAARDAKDQKNESRDQGGGT